MDGFATSLECDGQRALNGVAQDDAPVAAASTALSFSNPCCDDSSITRTCTEHRFFDKLKRRRGVHKARDSSELYSVH
jgi:hypothetical protein